MLKNSLLFKKNTTLRVNNSRIPRTKNAKFSEYYFYLNTNIYRGFQICISVPLIFFGLRYPLEFRESTSLLSLKGCCFITFLVI